MEIAYAEYLAVGLRPMFSDHQFSHAPRSRLDLSRRTRVQLSACRHLIKVTSSRRRRLRSAHLMLPLLTNTGPEFNLESLAPMFGHPGISALEYAGSRQKDVPKKTISLKGKAVDSPHDENRSLIANADTIEFGSPQLVVQDLSGHQRRRGTFINHTPRGYEMRSPKKTEFQPSSNDGSSRPYTSSYDSSAGSKTTSWNQHMQHTRAGSLTASDDIEADVIRSVDLDSKEMDTPMKGKTEVSTHTSTPASVSSSQANKAASQHLQQTNSTSPDSKQTTFFRFAKSPKNNEKRRRRQTPHSITIPQRSTDRRSSPLEPWVERHRQEAARYSLSDPAPRLDIEDIGDISAFQAIQEYFDNQTSTRPRTLSDHRLPLDPPNSPFSNYQRTSVSSLIEPSPDFPIEELEVPPDTIPGLFSQHPRGLNRFSSEFNRTVSQLTINSDFASTNQDQYSPYNKEQGALVIPKQRGPNNVPVGPAARAGTPYIGRIAPPILSHEALTATADLNDLSFYLKNTGPLPKPQVRQRRKPGLKMFKVGSDRKKTLAARVGSVESSSKAQKPRKFVPACAREKTTLGGVKHLEIMIPSDDLIQDQTITLPIAQSGSYRCSQHVSVTWTEEMLNPLASATLENAISDFNTQDLPPSTPTSPARSRKRSPTMKKPVPVEEHPLLTREEQTRARKLRDLQKIKRRAEEMNDDTVAKTPTTPVPSLGSRKGSLVRSVKDHCASSGERGNPTCTIGLLQRRVISLQRQNTELADALAEIVGFEAEDGDLDATAVLKAYQERKDSGYGQRSGIVFTT